MQVSENEMRYLKRKASGNKLLNAALWLVLIGALLGIIPSAAGVMDLMIIRLWMFAPMALLLIISVILAIIGLIMKLSAGKPPASLTKKNKDDNDSDTTNSRKETRSRGRRAASSDKKTNETKPARRSGPRHGRHGRH